MRISSALVILFAVPFTAMTAAKVTVAQTTGKPALFSQQPSMCIGGGFVAMASQSRHAPLLVIKIGGGGIQAPRELPIEGDIFGIKCGIWGVELQVLEDGSDHFSILPFELEDAIQQEPSQDIDYSLSKKPSMPRAIERRLSEFHTAGLTNLNMSGNWYVEVPRVRSRYVYEVHFVETETQSNGQQWWNVSIDLLEETAEKKIVTSIPLVREVAPVVMD